MLYRSTRSGTKSCRPAGDSCLHDRRLVPYYKYLPWELESFPLFKLELSAPELLRSLTEIVETGDWRIQQRLLREAKRVFTLEGYGEYFAWNMARFALAYSHVPNG